MPKPHKRLENRSAPYKPDKPRPRGLFKTVRSAALVVTAMTTIAFGPEGVLRAEEKAATPAKASQPKWQSLFDGKSLAGWKSANFGGEGEVRVEDGKIIMEMGSSLTGITYQKKVPKTNYEIRIEAMQVQGIDFFCGVTFPVADSYCSFIPGGWAGTVVGLSSIDGKDASENETTKHKLLKEGKWYAFRVRVRPERIQAWIDEELMIDQDIRGRKITTRAEVDLSQPLGISAWETKSAIRKIEIRRLKPE